jgi:hypothetical protein
MSGLGQATVGCHIANRDTHVGGDLDLSVHQCGVGLAVAHASPLNDILSVLALI